MKAIILAGGFGTRISEETDLKPKPMVLIGDKPILWHIMNIYAQQGISKFVIAGGYKFDVIEKWIESINFGDWEVEAIDTGLTTQTGGRIRQCMQAIGNERVSVTYGDGVGNIRISALIKQHEQSGKLATVTAVHPPARFGVIEIANGLVTHFGEKEHTKSDWINGGFFILEPEVLNYIESDYEPFENFPLSRLVASQQLSAYKHEGFWQPMDTLREKIILTELNVGGNPPWLNF